MKTIAFDESGYTGQDLVNKDQPVFTLASVNLTDEESKQLISLISTNAKELKFSKLQKNKKFEVQLKNLLNHSIISEDTVRIIIGHKEYMIIAQTVDKLIEPLAYQDGIDLYREGMNLALTNMIYYCMPAFCNTKIVDQYYEAFVKMFRNMRKEDVIYFYNIIEKLIDSSINVKFKDTLGTMYYSHTIITDILKSIDKFYLDVSATSFTILSDYWGSKLNCSFNIIADKSKPLEHYEWIFKRLKSEKIDAKVIGYGSKKMTLPLRINELNFCDSQELVQIQIADIIAGAAAYYGKSLTRFGKPDSLSKIIENSKISKLFLNPIWPHKAFTPEELNMNKTGNNAVDEITKILYY